METSLFMVTVSARIKKGDSYLLHQRSLTDRSRPGERSIVGGKLEPNLWYQWLEINIKKEIAEEVGIQITDNIQLIHNNVRMSFSGEKNRLRLLYLCERKSWEAQSLEDTNDVQWVLWNELNIFTPMNELLKEDIQSLQTYSIK